MRRSSNALFAALLLASASALALDMEPIKEPAPSPSDLRKQTGEDRPGQARENSTPSPSDLATEPVGADGDRTSSRIPDPRDADRRRAASGAGTTPPPPPPLERSR